MNNPRFSERLAILKGFDVSEEELDTVERRWLEEGANLDTLTRIINVDGTRKKALLRAFDLPEPEAMCSLLQAWRFTLEIRKAVSISPRVCLTGINPEGFGQPLLDTFQAFQEVISSARKRLIIIGYRLNDGDKALMNSLEMGMRERKLEVILLTDHLLDRLRERDQNRMLGWLNDSTLNFHLWSYEAEDKMELMHVKCMIADNSVAYIGSANFSYGGSKRNIEIGLIIRDGPTLQALEDVFRYLTSGNVDEVKLINYTLLRKSDVI
jgi:hypothetical protein